MRDTHRLKEKYELTLDNHQIVVLTVVLLVLVGGAFALGISVGKKLAADQPAVAAAEAPADILAAVDQKTDALDDLAKDASLTFHETLTKPAPQAAPEPAVAPKPEPVQAVATANAPPAAEAGQVKPEPVPTRTTDAGDLKQAFGRVQAKPADTSEDGNWTLQLSASQDRDEADRFAAGLRDKGYAPFIVRADVPGRGVWFRVRMGRFATRDAAQTYLADFQRETQMEAFVTPVK